MLGNFCSTKSQTQMDKFRPPLPRSITVFANLVEVWSSFGTNYSQLVLIWDCTYLATYLLCNTYL